MQGAYREYVTESQRSPRTMQGRSNAVTTFATGCQHRAICNDPARLA